MASDQIPKVKAFISYSWSSEAHESWVLDLATKLTHDGVHVVFDKWDLKVGHDANAFMEAMVTDPTVTKVLMICDRAYAGKADGRLGGVGKEAQILTAEIYEKASQDKYAALITERDDSGKPYKPAYYGGRQYIDFVEEERQETSYQQLLRWIFDKPKHVRPKLGEVPSFITDPDAVVTGTTSKFNRADEAIRKGGSTAGGFISDFGEALLAEFRSSKPIKSDSEPWDEVIIRSAEAMRPALRSLSELVLAETRYGGANIGRFITIFEKMGGLMYRPQAVNSWSESDFDSYRMMCYEGFLAFVAILINEQRFDLLKIALIHPYLIAGRERGDGPITTTYRVFSEDISSLTERKRRLNSNKIDLFSELISETYKISFPSMEHLIQADLLLYVRGAIASDGTGWEQWWPRTLIYADRYTATELFARSESLSFFGSWAPQIFGEISVSDFTALVAKLQEDSKGSFGFRGPSLVLMTNSKHLGVRP